MNIKKGGERLQIIGIDPGYAIVGWGVIQYEGGRFRAQDFGAVTTEAGMPFLQRLNQIYVEQTGKSLKEIEVAMERDNFMTAEEAVKFGLIDAVVSKK